MDIGRHFTLQELTHSNTATAEGIPNHPGPAEVAALRALCARVLDPLREALGKPITINCAYRGPVLNRRVGGVPNSQHLTGQAADLQSPQATVLELFKLTISLGLPYDQVIYEARSATSKWLHVSHVDGVNRGEIRVAKFGPDGKPQSYPLISKAEALAMTERVSRSRAVHLTYEEGADEPESAVQSFVPSAMQSVAPKAAPRQRPAPKKVAAEVAGKTARQVAGTAADKAADKAAPRAAAKKVAPRKTPAKKAATRSATSAAKKVEKPVAKKVAKKAAKKVPKKAAPKKLATR